MIVLTVLSLIMWLLVIPAGLGSLISGLVDEEERGFISLMVTGYLAFWSLFELTALPFLLFFRGKQVFPALSTVFAAVALVLSAAGFVLKRKEIKTCLARIRISPAMVGALMVLCFILAMNTRTAFFDGDEAYYTGQALAAQETGYLYYRSPYTGTWAYFDRRHAFAMLPVWEAFIGRMSGLHAAVVNHTVMSFVMIPLALGAAVLSAGLILKKKGSAGVFAMLFGVTLIFSRISIYTRGTFLLTRTSQGKAAAAAFYMTALLWLLSVSLKGYKEGKRFPLLLMISGLSAGLFSSLSLMLTVMFVMISFVLYSLRERELKPALYALISCAPQFLYLLIYMVAGS